MKKLIVALLISAALGNASYLERLEGKNKYLDQSIMEYRQDSLTGQIRRQREAREQAHERDHYHYQLEPSRFRPLLQLKKRRK